MSGYLSRFKGISVRDENSREIIKELVGDEIEIGYHLDPVFHYSFEKELPRIKRRKPYLALYAYDGLEEEYKEKIKKYADSRGLEIVCLQGYQGDFGEYVSASPFEVLAYIKNAECVVTTTFHGSVFSIKFNKMFCSFIRKDKKTYSNQGKLGDLLYRLGLADRIINGFDEMIEKMEEPIDYGAVNERISACVAEGLSYLKKHIGELK